MIAPRRSLVPAPRGPQRGLRDPRARASWLRTRAHRWRKYRPAGRGPLVVTWIVGCVMLLAGLFGLLGILAQIARGP